ncbi:hypothetical protein Riv7116_6841 [Rivularia sp. PCC 7116]|uniref:hypothetical protein n=1 Tax=Rivularia sp. PCC 7116 TaxID=373994 RepID=UPI00029ED5E8|nr:hypothetical protein [Rivularia sp. PCC 7116]AFY59157.1 hypothetical protein Riv7116_6841 [Rivularia sp. PCC 7116]
MLSRESSLVGLITTLLIGFTNQSAIAVNLTPSRAGWDIFNVGSGASTFYKRQAKYKFLEIEGKTELSPIYVQELPLGGTSGFLQKLESTYGSNLGWSYEIGENLNGSFDIEYYYACGLSTKNCGGNLYDPIARKNVVGVSGIVGAAFQLRYIPGAGDPTPGDNTLHWIQWVTSSGFPSSGDPINIIDTGKDHIETPFYDAAGAAKDELFVDRPLRIIPENGTWNAELYLVEQKDPENNPGKITIYNGVQWGWKNTANRRDEDPPVCPTPKSNKAVNVNNDDCIYSFSDSLYSDSEEDEFRISGLTPGANYYAYVDNDIPGNVCNPDTLLDAYHLDASNTDYYYLANSDDNNSPIGDGLASGLTGIVSVDGSINLNVYATSSDGSHIRGRDGGKYELNIKVLDSEDELEYEVGSSGGGGVSREVAGVNQNNPILPDAREGSWQVFNNVPGCRWYDPETTYGFEFQALGNTRFTEILNFPEGEDDYFTVEVGNEVIGEYGAGDTLDFTSLFDSGITNFRITDIDSLIGDTEETAFPIQLAFNDRRGSFKMRPISAPGSEPERRRVPESVSIFGLLAISARIFYSLRKRS